MQLGPLHLEAPLALLGLLALPLLWWLHRQARPRGDRVFSAFFLVEGADAAGRQGGRIRAPWLLAARMAAAAALTLAAAGPAWRPAGGTAVIAVGPFAADPGWAAPVTVIRAGRPPTVETGPVAPVLGPPDRLGALALAAEVAPGARVVQPATLTAPLRIDGAGAALDGDAVVVSATVTRPPDGPAPRLVIGDREVALTPRAGDWYHRGPLPPGPATIALGDERWPLCLPDAAPLRVADAGWPPAVEAVLAVLPDVARVPAADAEWRPGLELPRGPGRALFAPPITGITFAAEPERDAAPLWFAAPLPPPGAIVRRWRPLDDSGAPVLYAADGVVADHGTGPAGASRRFGFDPADSDLPATAGWPVLWIDALDADRAARGGCVMHAADGPLVVASAGPVEVEDALGRTQTVAATGGVAVIDGLDAAGHARLRDDAGRAVTVAVVPGAALAPAEAVAAPPAPGVSRARALLIVAAAFLLLAAALARRWTGALAAAVALAGLVDLPIGAGEPGGIVLAVDASGSMPPAETAATVAALEAALPEARRLEAGPGGLRLAPPATALGRFSGPTAHRPLLTAAAREARPGGVVVLVSDGRAPDGPVPLASPVFAVPVTAAAPDARVDDARALRLGDRVFVRATLASDRAADGEVDIAGTRVAVRLAPDRPRVVQAVLPAGAAEALVVRVEVAGDRQPGNDARPVAIEGEAPPPAVVVGAAAAPWAAAAGLEPAEVPAAALVEAGARLAPARAMFVHDQPADALDVADRLARWVEAGGVLVLAGRTRAFGPGGWSGTALDALSPLRSDPRPPGSGRVGVALLLDRSGSISREAGGIGVEGVGQLAGAVAAGLRPVDHLAVLGFGGAVEVLLPPTAVAELPPEGLPVPAIARGGTRLGPALDRARALLAPLPVEVRVIVVVGDGRVADAAAATERAAALRADGVRVLAALVGVEPEAATFAALAEATDGALVRPRPDALHVDVAGAVLAAAGDTTGAGGPVTAEAAWPGRVGGVPPPVDARVRVSARDGARVLARIAGEPLLAEWSVGRGRVIALATDTWALDHEQWASLLAPATAPRPRDARITADGDRLVYRGPVTDPPPGPLTVHAPEGATTLPWHPDGPGRAWAPFPPGPPALVDVGAPSSSGAVLDTVTRPPPAELRATGVDPGALALQAAVTGGAVLEPAALAEPATAAAIRAARRPTDRAPWPLYAALLALALALADAARWAGYRYRASASS
ncbi:MAG: BatA domain-containing protein [bacterium]